MLTSVAYTSRLASYAESDHYRSLPSEQRLKAIAQLAKKSMETSNKAPVYLQVELAKTTTSVVPFSVLA